MIEKISMIDFSQAINELEQVYGQLEPDQVEVYYKHLCMFTKEILDQAIADVIDDRSQRTFPVVGIINRAARGRVKMKASQWSPPAYCDKCECGGLISAETAKGLQVTYRCDCENGDAYKKTFLSRDQVIKKHGELKERPGVCGRIMRYKNILENPEDVFDGGVTVIFPCKNHGCVNEYSVDFHEEITSQGIIDFYGNQKEGKAGGLCDRCYYEAGRYYHLWS